MEFGSEFVWYGKTNEEEIFDQKELEGKDILKKLAKKTLVDDGETCIIEILDTSGQEEFSTLRDKYYRESQGIILAFSLIDEKSFTEMKDIYDNLQTLTKGKTQMILLGNKSDEKDRKVSKDEIKKFIKEKKLTYFETSAKEKINILESITELLKKIPRTDIFYKFVIVGSTGIGKSSFVIQFVQNVYIEDYDPTVEDVYTTKIKIKGLPKREEKKDIKKDDTPFNIIQEINQKVEKIQKLDTNIISITAGSVAKETDIVIHKPIWCSNIKCGAAFSKLDQVKNNQWKCRFCENENQIDSFSLNDLPNNHTLDYILQEAPKKKDDENLIIFCIDVSGSMCQSTKIPIGHGLVLIGREAQEQKKQIEALKEILKDSDIYIPRNNEQFISRISCVQSAIEMQIQELFKNHPNSKIILIAFNHDLFIFGGEKEEIISGSILGNYQQLLETGKSYKLPLKSLQETKDNLIEKLYNLKENGGTAIGSALVVSVGMASQKSNTEIIICTDGICNLGVGSLRENIEHINFVHIPSQTHNNYLKHLKNQTFTDIIINVQDSESIISKYDNLNPKEFFSHLSEVAYDLGTSISVIGIEGEDCQMENLSILADKTSGSVNLVNPLELQKKMREIIELEKVAKNVKVKIIIHPLLKFINMDKRTRMLSEHSLTYDIGNVTEESDVTVEYTIKDESLKPPESLPFQAQISFTKLDGTKCLRIITKDQLLTRDREKCESQANIAVMSISAVKNSTQMSKNGDYKKARMNLYSVQRMAERVVNKTKIDDIKTEEYSNFLSQATKLENELKKMEDKSEEKYGKIEDDNYVSTLHQYSNTPKSIWKSSKSDVKMDQIMKRSKKK